MDELKSFSIPETKVFRDGQLRTIKSTEVVPEPLIKYPSFYKNSD